MLNGILRRAEGEAVGGVVVLFNAVWGPGDPRPGAAHGGAFRGGGLPADLILNTLSGQLDLELCTTGH